MLGTQHTANQRSKYRYTGFTLLEMLVALSVMGLLFSLLYSSVYLGMRSWESAQERVAGMDRLRISWRFIHRALSQVKPISDPSMPSQGLLFQGSTQQLLGVIGQLADAGLPGLTVIRLEALPDHKLQLSYVALSAYQLADQFPSSQSTILIDDLEQLDITYFGRQAAASQARWHTSWLDSKRLPTLIRIQITSQAIGVWPVLMVAPGG